MTDYSKHCKFLPVTKEKTYKTESNPNVKHGVYDIHYTIGLVKQILFKVHEMRLNPKELQFTLDTSLTKILAFLETEANNCNNK